MSAMRILQIAPRLCWPLDTGAKIRNFYLARGLAQHASVSLLAFADREQSVPELQKFYDQVVTVQRARSYTVSKIVRGALGKTPLPVLNYTTESMKKAVARLLAEKDFAVVQIESVHLIEYLPLIRGSSGRPLVVCDWHNIESELMGQYAEHDRNLFRRGYARRTARLLREFEQRALKDFDAHICVSERDAERLRQFNPEAKVYVIENGVDTSYYLGQASNDTDASRSRILFVGSMDYHANIDAVANFARDVWPRVHARNLELVFTIVGKDPHPQIRQLENIDGIEVTGTVDDVRPFYRQAVASIVPLRVGGGSRLKILEAIAAGVPVISTTLGAEGLGVQNGENILIADDTSEFVEAIVKVLENESLRQRLINAGRALVTERYDWSKLGKALFNLYNDLKSRSLPPA